MDFSVLIFFLVSIITAVYIYFKNAFNYWKLRGIPFVKPIFPFGNLKVFQKPVHVTEFSQEIYNKLKGNSKYCGIYMFAAPVAMILDLDLVRSILVTDFGNFTDKGLYSNEKDDPLSASLFTLDGEKWKKLRNKFTPSFTPAKMKFCFSTVVEVGERLKYTVVERIKENKPFELKDLISRFTTDVIGTCAFGIECNSLKNPSAEFKEMGQKVFKFKHSKLVEVLVTGFKDLARRLHVKPLLDDVSAFFRNVVRETVEYREKNNVHRNDFMDILIKLKNEGINDVDKLTLNEIAAQTLLFFVAGLETTSATLTFSLYELAVNPEMQTKARKEVQEAYKKHGTLTYEMIMDIPYIEQVIKGIKIYKSSI